MPCLKKKPFQRLHVSSDYKDDDEVFHCEITNEIFKDYNEYCERIILCNSTIWSCSITGKTNMTYEEALLCEENAKRTLREFPLPLRVAILYLATKVNKPFIHDVVEDIYQFGKERYFIGEIIEANLKNDLWCECHVIQVIEPSEGQILAYRKNNPKNPSEKEFEPAAKLFRYEVESLDSKNGKHQLEIIEASRVRRKKLIFTQERIKIFLRMLCEQNSSGIWVVKQSIQQKYDIPKVRFDTIFSGPLPDFTQKPKKIVKQKQITMDKFLTTDVSKHRVFDKPDPLRKINNASLEIKKRSRKKTIDKLKDIKGKTALQTEKDKIKAMSVEEKEANRREKQIKRAALMAYIKAWKKPREDLECENLYPLVEPIPVKCNIPDDKFGDFAMILEFLEYFYEELEVTAYFPQGLSFETLEKSIEAKDLAGTFSDLLQLLLANIFKFQKEEDSEINESISSNPPDNDVDDDPGFDHGITSKAEAVKLATRASAWCQTHYGCKLSDQILDNVTVSEILRQHLLTSGCQVSEITSKWRFAQRGGYRNQDDPGLLFQINYPRILRTLSHRSVFDLDLNDKLCILTCLINQLLTFAGLRDVIEERYETIQQARRDLKLLILAEHRREREEKLKEKEKEKEKDKDKEMEKDKTDDKGEMNKTEVDKTIKTRSSGDENKKREDIEKKMAELREMSKDKKMVYLGSDRAYRRYWKFTSIPGLFVENDEKYFGSCLNDGTPYISELQNKDFIDEYLTNKFENECCDKENNFDTAQKTLKKSTSTVTTATTSSATTSSSSSSSSTEQNNINKLSIKELTDIRIKLMSCTADKDCPVHKKRSTHKWSFYGRLEDIESLKNNLNSRGYRESELLNNITEEIDGIKSLIENCPRHKLNPDVFDAPISEQVNKPIVNMKKINTKADSGNPSTSASAPVSDLPVDNIMELNLRDSILDLEDKIRAGSLGSIKIKNRDLWIKAINDGKYDKQCNKIVYSHNETEVVDVPSNLAVEKVKYDVRSNSRPGTPDSDAGSGNIKIYRDPSKFLGPPGKNEPTPDENQQKTIRQMACAILQLSQAIEPKFFKKPLGLNVKDSKKPNAAEAARERWEQSLMSSTSWSQLFLHFNLLENNIAWNRSTLNARCRVCRKSKDADQMLLCDGCNKGTHLYCLRPKLTSVPAGDWYCSICKPREVKPKSPGRVRKAFDENEDEEEDIILPKIKSRARRRLNNNDSEDLDYNPKKDKKVIKQSKVRVAPKVTKEPSNKLKKSNDNHSNQLNGDASAHLPAEVEKSEGVCSICNEPEDLIACDICPKSYHIECLDPPLTRAPRGRWSCYECKDSKKNSVKVRGRERDAVRHCATAARSRIHDFVKSLLCSDSADWDGEITPTDDGKQRQTRRATKRSAPAQDQRLHELLKNLMHHRDSWPFLVPVTIDEVPDYYDFIKKPMDFDTIKKKLDAGEYDKNPQLMMDDCRLIFSNCFTYNEEHSKIYQAGSRLSKYFDKRCKELDFDGEINQKKVKFNLSED